VRRKPTAEAGYPIRAVARITGLSLDTLRAWERRYRVVAPARDDRGRMYSSDDVRRLQLLAAVVARGHAIGRAALLSNPQLDALLTAEPDGTPAASGREAGEDPALRPLFAALETYDSAGVERELNRLSTLLRPRDLVRRVLFDALRRVGDEWHADRMTIAQEHILSAAVRNLLGSMMKLFARDDVPRRLLFATPGGERHEFGILAAAMLSAAGGLGVVYVGSDVPGRQIVDAAARSGVDAVVLGVLNTTASKDIRKHLDYVATHLPGRIDLWVGGVLSKEAQKALTGRQVVILPEFDAFERHIISSGARF
jgi:MerR family transcriptional regulator, light-induced transcriptional regulator